MSRLRRLTWASLFLVALTTSCTGSEADPDPSSTAPPTTTTLAPTTTTSTTVPPTTTTTVAPIEWDYSISDPGPMVTVLDTGAEPRELRQYTMSQGTVSHFTARFVLIQTQIGNGELVGENDIQVDFEVTTEVAEVVADGYVLADSYGDYRVSTNDRSTQANFNMVYAVLAADDAPRQLMAPSGQILAVEIKEQPGVFDELVPALAGGAVPLPTEPIGVGARWQVDSIIEIAGIEIVQTSTVTLREIDGSVLVVEVETEQVLGPGFVGLPGLEEAEVDLTGSGSGLERWDLSSPIPSSASTEASQVLTLSLAIDGQEEETFEQETTTLLEMPSPIGDLGGPLPDHFVSLSQANEGDCVDQTGRGLFVVLVPCSQPHDLEVYAVFTNPDPPGAPEPGFEDAANTAFQVCGSSFFTRVDPELGTGLVWSAMTYPVSPFWEQGQRRSVCALWADNESKITGSQLLAASRFDAVADAEFGDEDSEIRFPGSTFDGEIVFVGSAHQNNETLVLTTFAEHAQRSVPFQQEGPQRGAAWYSEPVAVGEGFTTAFVFQMEIYSWFTVGDGFAFVIQPVDTEALGGGIGYDGMRRSLAVEFDTLKEDWLSDPLNNIPEAPDLLGNHVAVHTQGISPNDTHTDAALGFANLEGLVMADRSAHVVLIAYEPGQLDIFIDDFETPVLTVDVDLGETLALTDGMAYVGFTASSGPQSSRGPRTSTIAGHKIFTWEFSSGAR